MPPRAPGSDWLFNLADDSPGLQLDVNNELADLDTILKELKEDLNDDADNQEVVEAMMQNLVRYFN